MATLTGKLTIAFCNGIAKVGRYSDGQNLYLQVAPGGTKAWKYIWNDKLRVSPTTGKSVQRELGLGGYPKIDLQHARKLRNDILAKITEGLDPQEERVKDQVVTTLFSDIAQEIFERRVEAGWKKDADLGEHRTQSVWERSFINHTPFWNKPAADVTDDAVVAVLKPLWKTQYPTALLLMNRIFVVMEHAIEMGAHKGPNPARYEGHLSKKVGEKKLNRKQESFAAFEPDYLPKVLRQLRAWQKSGTSMLAAKALMLTIFTGVRTANTIRAQWDEFDIDAKVWRLTGDRMKVDKEFTVPLTDQALAVLADLKALNPDSDYLFPAGRKGKRGIGHIVATAMDKLLCDDMGYRGDATVHGMRTSLKTWAIRNSFDRHAASITLAHAVGSKSDQAYDGEELLAYRHEMLSAWADHCDGKKVDGPARVMKAMRRQAEERFGAGENVVSLRSYKKKAA